MSTKLSGAKRRKIEREKKEKIDHILQNTKKINSFFSKQEVTAEKSLEKSSIKEQALTLTANACDADTDTQTTNIIIVNEESSLLSPQKTQTASSEKNGEKHEIATASSSKTETLIVQDELQISKSVEDFNIGNDPAEWHITDKNLIIDSILKNPPQQNIDDELKVDIKNCRGQSYDNASNMTGLYTGLQARIKKHNDLALFVPCAAHSLNLVGAAAAESCYMATEYFMFVQQIFNFFSSSTNRWNILKTNVNEDLTVRQGEIIIFNQLIPKSLSTTRWSARADACKALSVSYNTFRKSVEEIAHSKNEKPSVQAEAMGLLGKFNSLETGILTSFWSDVLEKCDKASKTLQTVDIDLSTTIAIFESLIGYLKSLRDQDQFDKYEERGKQLSKIMEYNKDQKKDT
ncbi:hypothetical protein NQ314_010200 [Rhamnusium bicolor]|uniref:Zinc finger MYM-type protein 1-like n=1 Tax=Rhamnusium bicolor TaxID=1586634 RepID=A0AAV8XUP6_9CUCU|nr:hypothetical protein NQ314_010200 [Rhamnusium bicolor]